MPGPRQRADTGHARLRGDLRLAVPRLARPALPTGAARARLAGALRQPVRHGGEQQHLLPAARAGGVRGLAGADPGRLRDGHQGEPVPDPRQAAAGPGGCGAAAAGSGQRSRPPAGAGAAPAAAGPASRPRPAGRLPGRLHRIRRPGRTRPGRLSAGRGRAAPSLLVERGGAAGAGRAWRGAVLGRPGGPPGDAAVADRGLGVPAVSPGRGPAVAALRRRRAALLAGPGASRVAEADVYAYFNNDPGGAAVADSAAFAAACRRAGMAASRTPAVTY